MSSSYTAANFDLQTDLEEKSADKNILGKEWAAMKISDKLFSAVAQTKIYYFYLFEHMIIISFYFV